MNSSRKVSSEIAQLIQQCDDVFQTPVSFTEPRHSEHIEGEKLSDDRENWRMKDRMKTVSVALVLCLNIGVDPPDVAKVWNTILILHMLYIWYIWYIFSPVPVRDSNAGLIPCPCLRRKRWKWSAPNCINSTNDGNPEHGTAIITRITITIITNRGAFSHDWYKIIDTTHNYRSKKSRFDRISRIPAIVDNFASNALYFVLYAVSVSFQLQTVAGSDGGRR